MNDFFEETLLRLAQGRLPIDAAQAALRKRAAFSFGTNPAWVTWRKPLASTVSIPLTVEDISRALDRFLVGSWGARDLHLWAQFIALVDAYDLPAPPPHDEDYYDEAWGVVLDLSSPEVHGVATETSVRRQLAQLKRYRPVDAP